jgi:bacteriocin-like protein
MTKYRQQTRHREPILATEISDDELERISGGQIKKYSTTLDYNSGSYDVDDWFP